MEKLCILLPCRITLSQPMEPLGNDILHVDLIALALNPEMPYAYDRRVVNVWVGVHAIVGGIERIAALSLIPETSIAECLPNTYTREQVLTWLGNGARQHPYLYNRAPVAAQYVRKIFPVSLNNQSLPTH